MNAEKTNRQAEHASSKATANQAGNGGVKMPAVAVLQNKGAMQLQKAEEDPIKLQTEAPAQLEAIPAIKPNNTGMPDNLKNGIENLSGLAMDDVKVHYNSSEPAQLSAHAYAQGTDIHVAPGQEKHLPHEAWHVVQQKQGRVQPTTQLKNIAVNDNQSLEQEADNMGAKAVQMKAATAFKPLQKSAAKKVAQLAVATSKPDNGPVNLTEKPPAGAGGFSVMYNAGQPDGEAVKDSVGFTDILDADNWGDFGKSPRDYHRAHGYAKSFGGAGDATNVGWWGSDKETTWTVHEQNVRGAGEAAIPAWRPGTGETGTYSVTREDYPRKSLQEKYLPELVKAAEWGLSDSRAAWTRVVAKSGERPNRYTMIALNAEKARLKAAIEASLSAWLGRVFGVAETNLIKSMNMNYAITNAGVGAGASRGPVNQTIRADSVLPSSFGLKSDPEGIWKAMVNNNEGAFSKGGVPLQTLTVRLASAIARDIPLELTAYEDGWGIE